MDHLKVRKSTSNIKQVLGPLESLLPGLLGQGVGPVGSLSSRPMGPRAGGLRSVQKILEMYAPLSLPRPRIRIARGGSRPQHLGMDQAALENALQVLTQQALCLVLLRLSRRNSNFLFTGLHCKSCGYGIWSRSPSWSSGELMLESMK